MKELLQNYIKKLVDEQDSLIAKFINQTGAKPDEICIVERETQSGRVFYPDFKRNHILVKETP